MRSTADGRRDFDGAAPLRRSLAARGRTGARSRPAEAAGATGRGAAAVGALAVGALRIGELEIGRIRLRSGGEAR